MAKQYAGMFKKCEAPAVLRGATTYNNFPIMFLTGFFRKYFEAKIFIRINLISIIDPSPYQVKKKIY